MVIGLKDFVVVCFFMFLFNSCPARNLLIPSWFLKNVPCNGIMLIMWSFQHALKHSARIHMHSFTILLYELEHWLSKFSAETLRNESHCHPWYLKQQFSLLLPLTIFTMRNYVVVGLRLQGSFVSALMFSFVDSEVGEKNHMTQLIKQKMKQNLPNVALLSTDWVMYERRLIQNNALNIQGKNIHCLEFCEDLCCRILF